MRTTRRSFLATGLSAGAAAPFLGKQLAPSLLAPENPPVAPEDNILVVVQMRGGMDYVNAMPEVDHPIYQAARPALKLPKAKVLTVQTGLSTYWHPAMAAFKALLDRGDLVVIQNVGYPQPNLSHFLSEKKWYAGDPTVVNLSEGWLASYLKKGYGGSFQIPAINLDTRQSEAFTSVRVPVFRTLTDFQYHYDAAGSYAGLDNVLQAQVLLANALQVRIAAGENLKFAAAGTASAIADSKLLQTVGSSYKPLVTYPSGSLASNLQLAARYITGGLKTQVYYTSTGGFDTHSNLAIATAPETGRLADLLQVMTDTVKAFLDDIKAYNYHQKVVVMMFTEFGRRLGENGSLGADHGHGGVAFLAGDPVNPGLYGTAPDLNLATTPYDKYYFPFVAGKSTDFRSLYATVIEKWFGVQHSLVLNGTFPLLAAL